MPAAPLVSTTVTLATYNTTPDISVDFEVTDLTVWNESTNVAEVAYASFDGVNDHWKLVPTTATAAISMSMKHTKMWFRLASAGSVVVTYMGGTR